MGNILVLSADSDIAKACSAIYAKEGYSLILAGRHTNALSLQAQNISHAFNTSVHVLHFDALQTSTHQDFFNQVLSLGELDGLLCFTGLLGEQDLAQQKFEIAHNIIQTNFTGLVSIINLVSQYFENIQSGFIVGISSVAGDRGRKSNYIYGASKAAFSTYLAGLRNRLFAHNVSVLTVKPGFVNTKMTQGLNFPALLSSSPEQVAQIIFNAQQKKKNSIYIKPFWRGIMFIIRLIPESLFKRLNL